MVVQEQEDNATNASPCCACMEKWVKTRIIRLSRKVPWVDLQTVDQVESQVGSHHFFKTSTILYFWLKFRCLHYITVIIMSEFSFWFKDM